MSVITKDKLPNENVKCSFEICRRILMEIQNRYFILKIHFLPWSHGISLLWKDLFLPLENCLVKNVFTISSHNQFKNCRRLQQIILKGSWESLLGSTQKSQDRFKLKIDFLQEEKHSNLDWSYSASSIMCNSTLNKIWVSNYLHAEMKICH